ncbi:MAG: hypothetical protein AAF230_05000 [Pseudomonadota bacterium]
MRTIMWAIAIGYPVGLAAVAVLLMRQDPKWIFDQYYMMITLAVLPAFFLSVIVVIARQEGAPNAAWSSLLGLWVLLVTGGHLWFIRLMV